MTLPQPPPDPISNNILSLLDPAFVSSLNAESRAFLGTVPYTWSPMHLRKVDAGYNVATNKIEFKIGTTPSRTTMEHEALHALTVGKDTKGGGLGRFGKRLLYPGSYFRMSEDEKRDVEKSYYPKQTLWDKVLWAGGRGVESGPMSWTKAEGIWGDMPQAAQDELGQFFDQPPPKPLSNYTFSEAMSKPVVESETSFLPGAPKVDQSVVPPKSIFPFLPSKVSRVQARSSRSRGRSRLKRRAQAIRQRGRRSGRRRR